MLKYYIVFREGEDSPGEERSILRVGPGEYSRYDRWTKSWVSDELANRFGVLWPDKKEISASEVPEYIRKFDVRDAPYINK